MRPPLRLPQRFGLLLLVLVLVATALSSIHALQFDLEARSYKCFREELPTNFDVYGEFDAQQGFGQAVDFRVTDPHGRVMVDRKDINKGDFSFQAKLGGEYSMCFFNRLLPGVAYRPGMNRRIAFDVLTGTETFDYENLAKKEHMKPVEINLKQMEDVVKSVFSEYVYFRQRQSSHSGTSESTHQRVLYLGLFCVAFGVASGIVQIIYLRRYFIRKKIV